VILSPGDGETPTYSDRCVVCGARFTESTPAALLVAVVEHYDTHRPVPR
jgi:hypothetical protein